MGKMNEGNIQCLQISRIFFDKGYRAIYVIKGSLDNSTAFYVGITGISPLKRLFRHLYPLGKTFSITKSNKKLLENDLSFFFVQLLGIEDEEMRSAENWLISHFVNGQKHILNQNGRRGSPGISPEIEGQLIKLYNKAIG